MQLNPRHRWYAASIVALAGAFVVGSKQTEPLAAAAMLAPCETPVSAPSSTTPKAPTNVRITGAAEAAEEFDENGEALSGPHAAPEPRAAAAAATSNTYYDTLVNRPDCMSGYSLRDAAQVNRYKSGTYPNTVSYDYARDPFPQKQDAAKWTWGDTGPKGLNPNAEQIRVPIGLTRPASGSSKVLIISDHWWDDSWFTEWIELRDDGTKGRLEGWKWQQVTDNVTGNQNIWFEPQMRFIGRDGILALFGARGYNSVRAPTVKGGSGLVIDGVNYGSDGLGPMLHSFGAKAFTWTRSYIEVEQRAGDGYAHLSLWMADETRDPVVILRDAQMVSGGINGSFYIEYNTSRPKRIGGPMVAYAKNIVILKNVADPTSVFARPIK